MYIVHCRKQRIFVKLTFACVWYLIVPFPIGSPPMPFRTRNIPCGDDRFALWHIAVPNGACVWVCACCAPNPIGIVIRVPAEVVLNHIVGHMGHIISPFTAVTLCPLQTSITVNRFSRPAPVVNTFGWFLLAPNNIISLPSLPDHQASASASVAVDFWWSWNKFFPLLALTAATTIRTPVARPIFIIVIAPESAPAITIHEEISSTVELSLCEYSL